MLEHDSIKHSVRDILSGFACEECNAVTQPNRKPLQISFCKAVAAFVRAYAVNDADGYNASVWRKFHILSRRHVIVVTSICALAIAFAIGLSSKPAESTSMNRFLGPPRYFDPLINFGSAYVSVIPLLLGYYHLAWRGALVSLAVSAVMCFRTRVFAFFVFAFPFDGHSVVFREAAYVSVCLLLSGLVFAVHMKASNSRAILDIQRSLNLVPALRTR